MNPPVTHSLLLPAAGALALAAAFSAAGADLTFYSVSKGHAWVQTNSVAPVLKGVAPYLFFAEAVPTNSSVVFNASVTLPTAGTRPLFSSGPAPLLSFSDRAASQSALDGTYASGTYSFSFFTAHDGSRNNLTLPLGTSVYPSAPRISNPTDALSIDPTAPFGLAWVPIPGGTTKQFVQLRLESCSGTVLATGAVPGATNSLNGTNSSFTIPAGTLAPGRSYLAHLLFENFTSTNLTYTGAPGYAGYWSQTDFYVTTIGPGDPTPPVVVSLTPANSATGVPRNIPLTVTFNKPMGSGFSMTVYGTTNSFAGVWSADHLTCTVSSTNPWPANTALQWYMNPSTGSPVMGDSQGDPLMSDTPTAFTTGTAILPAVPAAPSFPVPPVLTNGFIHLVLAGEAYRNYGWQSSSDLVNWTAIATNMAPSGRIDFFDPFQPGLPALFYRVQALP